MSLHAHTLTPAHLSGEEPKKEMAVGGLGEDTPVAGHGLPGGIVEHALDLGAGDDVAGAVGPAHRAGAVRDLGDLVDATGVVESHGRQCKGRA